MKKIMKVFMTVFAFSLVFAAGVKVDAAEVEMNVETGKDRNVVKMMGAPEFAIHYINPAKTSASFAIDYSHGMGWTRIGIFDVKGRLVTYDDALSYATVTGLKPNQLYYYRAQSINSSGVSTSGWSSAKAFVTLKDKKLKLKAVKNKRAFTVQVPKLAGIKNYTVYVSRNRDKGYKKVATIKPGKKVTISKFKKKPLGFGKQYYVKITLKTKKNVTCGNNFIGYVYFYRTYR